jgi:hypothetical protein
VNAKLLYQFDQLENDRTSLLRVLSKHPESKLDNKLDSGDWSINQILIHLLTSEQLTLGYLKKKSLGVDQLGTSGAMEWVKLMLLNLSQRMPFKFKAPTVLVENTPNAMPLPDLVERWDSSRKELGNFLETIHDDNLHKLIFKHPIAGRFDVLQCLTFMRAHFQHHLPQINRLL